MTKAITIISSAELSDTVGTTTTTEGAAVATAATTTATTPHNPHHRVVDAKCLQWRLKLEEMELQRT